MYNKEKTKEARALLYGQGAPEKWAQRLMARVYVSFSAALSFDREGKIIELFQFDTFFPEGEIIVAKDAAQVWLMSNHPEGMRRMMQEESASGAGGGRRGEGSHVPCGRRTGLRRG